MFKKLYLFLLLPILLAGCNTQNPEPSHPNISNLDISESSSSSKNEPLKIVATFYPLYDFTSNVIGKNSENKLESIVPAGIEPHDYAPSPKEIQSIYDADLFIYNGAGVDPWVDSILPDLEKNGVHVLNMSKTVSLLDPEASNEEEAEEGHENLIHDPHFWLDPILAKNQVEAIKEALIEINPAKKNEYEVNTQQTLDKLTTLDNDFRNNLKTCTHKEAVVTHNAFRYLANDYGIELLPISGISPEEEPSAKALANLTNLSKEKEIKYVFFETLASPKLAETLAKEIGAKTLVLNPLEGLTMEEQATGKDYFSVMQENLKNLKTAMECQ